MTATTATFHATNATDHAASKEQPNARRTSETAAHPAYGLGAAGTAEAVYWLGRNGGARRSDRGD